MDLVKEAKIVASTNGRACVEDVDLLVKILDKTDDTPTVVILGAGEVFVLTVLGTRPNAKLYSVDTSTQSLGWEEVALKNCKMPVKRKAIIGDTVKAAGYYGGPKIDVLIVDADHSFKGTLSNLKAWAKHMNKDLHYVFCHDYDAEEAPTYCEEVKQACDSYFTKRFSWRSGWSAVWKVAGK